MLLLAMELKIMLKSGNNIVIICGIMYNFLFLEYNDVLTLVAYYNNKILRFLNIHIHTHGYKFIL
jgi:hypothetical protein